MRIATLSGLILALSVSASAQTRVVVLGTGTPNPDPERSGPALAVVVGGRAYLVDAGPGIVRRAAAAEASGIPELTQAGLSRVFLTHLHSDHTAGLPDLMLLPWVLGRTDALEVYGPPGTRDMVRHLAAAYRQDVELRRHSAEPANQTGWRTLAREVDAGPVFADASVKITAFRVPHTAWPVALGYAFETADRRIVISGDCTPNDEVVRQCHGCDLLVHEVYSSVRFETRPPEWRRYHAQAHTSTRELAALAARARPKRLVLYHQIFWGESDDELVAEVKQGYSGEVVSARDLGVY